MVWCGAGGVDVHGDLVVAGVHGGIEAEEGVEGREQQFLRVGAVSSPSRVADGVASMVNRCGCS
ncbi:hypothetical protein [Salinispora arenicola]|uniref:hypothetical protein n=1 Tax=Salinispora arenicola TaxID=168697 RepID=UPI00168E68F8|nr:hypothetical protein [Salinispora arenicola]NIL64863.1 hypothetical protein [Salinispora arenicola]